MQLRTNYPLAKPLPIPQERIERGPFFADAKRLIKKDFLLQSRPPPQKATAQLFLMDHFKRMAVQRKMLPPPTLGIDTRMWMNEMLDMLREFIAYTPKNERCMCATMNLPEFHDHWLECPIGIVMKRARAAMSKKESDRKEAMQDRVTNVVAHSQSDVLRELTEVQFLGIEERMKAERERRNSMVSMIFPFISLIFIHFRLDSLEFH